MDCVAWCAITTESDVCSARSSRDTGGAATISVTCKDGSIITSRFSGIGVAKSSVHTVALATVPPNVMTDAKPEIRCVAPGADAVVTTSPFSVIASTVGSLSLPASST